MNVKELYGIYQLCPSIQTDTRKLKAGDLFFALKGPNFNANAFAAEALERGAEFAVIDEARYHIPGKTILVEDVLTTLQQLAGYHRQQFDIPFIAITGSNGKTTTKELISQVLASTYITYTTEGNLNNHIGIPLTLLRIKKDAQMAVIEMGANHLREIAGYCQYTRPTHGIITNCGKAHLEGFGSIEGVRKGKGELYDYLRTTGGTAFVMQDYDYLREMSRGIPYIITYGTQDSSVEGKIESIEPFLKVGFTKGMEGTISTQLVGAYNLPNVLAAVTVGKHFNVPGQAIKKAIETYAPSNSRSQLLNRDSNQIILDAYNANPSSLKLAIENLAGMKGDSKILLLGAMAELGEESLNEHAAIISLIEKYVWKAVVLVGGDFLRVPHHFVSFTTSEQAQDWYKDQHFRNSLVLIKGSRSIKMEKVLD